MSSCCGQSSGTILSNFAEDGQVAGFVNKTFEMLGVEDFQKIVYWAANGQEFVIKDVVKFQELVLPRYFRHKKMNSFVRQLNMYGFHKMKHNNFKSTFRHESFRKDRADLLPLIRRKPKLNELEHALNEPKSLSRLQSGPQLTKQEEPTMTQERWANLSQEFLQTTKMINMSLVKVSFNELREIAGLIPQEDDCVSIEEDLDQKEEISFQDPSCFFASSFQL